MCEQMIAKPKFPKELKNVEFFISRVIGTAHRKSLKTFILNNQLSLKQFVAAVID